MTPASGCMCGCCGQNFAYGETHICHGDWAENTIMYSPPPTELSLEDRVARLETYVDDLRKAVEQLIEWIPCKNE